MIYAEKVEPADLGKVHNLTRKIMLALADVEDDLFSAVNIGEDDQLAISVEPDANGCNWWFLTVWFMDRTWKVLGDIWPPDAPGSQECINNYGEDQVEAKLKELALQIVAQNPQFEDGIKAELRALAETV